MKKRTVTLLLIVIACGVVLATVATLLWPQRPLPLPTLRFLQGHEPMLRLSWPGSYEAHYYFAGDFNDVCAEVDAELTALGGWKCVLDLPDTRWYSLRRANGIDSVLIGQGLPDDGCVSVAVTRRSRAVGLRGWLQRLIWRVRNRLEGALW